MGKRHKRRIKLIKPGLQLKIVAYFAGLLILALIFQYVLMASRITSFAITLPEGGAELSAQTGGMLFEILVTSLAVLLPLCLAIGVIATFKVAGPVYRFEQYLKEVIAGKQLGPCRIRRGDELQDLCALINEATEPLRMRQAPSAEDDAADDGPEELRRAG